MNPAYRRHYGNLEYDNIEEQIRKAKQTEDSIIYLKRFREWNSQY